MRRPALTKGHITKIAIQILTLRGTICWPQNNVRAVKGRSFVGRKGVMDIIGFHKHTGLFIGCEVKTRNDRLRPEQIELLTQLRLAGGQALLAMEDEKGGVKIVEYGGEE